jgi:hypothetical protein
MAPRPEIVTSNEGNDPYREVETGRPYEENHICHVSLKLCKSKRGLFLFPLLELGIKEVHHLFNDLKTIVPVPKSPPTA